MSHVLGSTTLHRCALAIGYFDGSSVAAAFATLPGNRAKENQNRVSIWQDSVIPWQWEPMASMGVPVAGPSGTVAMSGVSIARLAYTLGYAVGPDPTDYCACITLGADGQTGEAHSVGLTLGFLGSTALLLRYSSLPGYRPASAGSWVGVWEGRVNPFDAPEPLGRQPIARDTDAGDVCFNDLPLAVETSYSAVYFMGKSPTTAAAQLTFATSRESDVHTQIL
jgi:hypothetical protein